MLVLHFIGLVMGLGTGFARAFLGKTLSQMEFKEAIKFRKQITALSYMGHSGILLLLISGIYLIVPYWPVIASLPLLILKLILVAVLIVLLLLIAQATHQNYKNNMERNLKRIEFMGKISLLIGVVIVIVAVKIFN